MIIEDQSEVIEFLSDPETYSQSEEIVQKIETHGAIVFLAGDRAYKLKRAVRFEYMDFSTRDRRRTFCEAEIRVNARTAPAIYLGVLAIIRSSDGSLGIVAPENIPVGADVLDWVVKMVRFEQTCLFDRMAEQGTLTENVMTVLADRIALFHSNAEVRADMGGLQAHRAVIETNHAQFVHFYDALFDKQEAQLITDAAFAELDQCGDEIERRRAAGLVRHCHGDMHLQNIFLWEGLPTLFDAIEFDEQIACVDVLYDLAFLLMDLNERGMKGFANLIFNRYVLSASVTEPQRINGLKCLPLFLSCRAGVRAHVSAATAETHSDEGRRKEYETKAKTYLASAARYLEPRCPRAVVIGGLSGTGKSALSAELSPELGPAPGALWIRSDSLRKWSMGEEPLQKLGPEAYSSEVNERVYRIMLELMRRALQAGHSVIVDAVFAREAERVRIEREVRSLGVIFTGLWLEAPWNEMERRIQGRREDSSDATVDILKRQLEYDLGAVDWVRIDASGSQERTLSLVQRLLQERDQLDFPAA